jgi:hypothetical protein
MLTSGREGTHCVCVLLLFCDTTPLSQAWERPITHNTKDTNTPHQMMLLLYMLYITFNAFCMK